MRKFLQVKCRQRRPIILTENIALGRQLLHFGHSLDLISLLLWGGVAVHEAVVVILIVIHPSWVVGTHLWIERIKALVCTRWPLWSCWIEHAALAAQRLLLAGRICAVIQLSSWCRLLVCLIELVERITLEPIWLELIWRCWVTSILSTISKHLHWIYSQRCVWDLISNLDRSCLLTSFRPRILTWILIALWDWRPSIQVLILFVPRSALCHLLILQELLLLRLLHLLVNLVLLSGIEVPIACRPCLVILIIAHPSCRRWHLLLICWAKLALLIEVLLQHELIVHIHLLLLAIVLVTLSLWLKRVLRWHTSSRIVHLIVKTILILLLHLLLVASHSSLRVVLVHVWHHISVHVLIWVKLRAWIETCHLCLDIIHLSTILRHHILHRVHLARILQHLSNSTSISSLTTILIAHTTKIHIVLHIWQVGHILKIIHSIEVIIALIHLHIVKSKALRHLVLIELRKLLLIWNEILIGVWGAVWCPLVWKLLGIGACLLDNLSYVGCWTLVVVLALALAWLGGTRVCWDLVLLHGEPDDVNWNRGWHLGLVLLRQEMRLGALAVQVVACMILVPNIVLMAG